MRHRYLYLARHGEALGGKLTERGKEQARLLGRRLKDVPLTTVHHSPLHRGTETAHLVGQELDGVPAHACELAGDYVPHFPVRSELPEDSADFVLDWLSTSTPEEREQGPDLARRALAYFTSSEAGHELVITHAFLIAWLVREAMQAPTWRWIGLNQGNTALTVIRYTPRLPTSVLIHNDTRHLPDDLRWTGFPPEMRA